MIWWVVLLAIPIAILSFLYGYSHGAAKVKVVMEKEYKAQVARAIVEVLAAVKEETNEGQ